MFDTVVGVNVWTNGCIVQYCTNFEWPLVRIELHKCSPFTLWLFDCPNSASFSHCRCITVLAAGSAGEFGWNAWNESGWCINPVCGGRVGRSSVCKKEAIYPQRQIVPVHSISWSVGSFPELNNAHKRLPTAGRAAWSVVRKATLRCWQHTDTPVKSGEGFWWW